MVQPDVRLRRLVWCVAALAAAQPPAQWAPLRHFEGAWEGTGMGRPGVSKVERRYEFILRGRFLQANHRSVYEPRDANPKGEVHEEIGLFSYDRSRKGFRFRQFHVEGFVNQYAVDVSADGKTIVATSEAIENIPPGWRARETWKILSGDEFEEVFELAEPGGEYAVYVTNKFKRKR